MNRQNNIFSLRFLLHCSTWEFVILDEKNYYDNKIHSV